MKLFILLITLSLAIQAQEQFAPEKVMNGQKLERMGTGLLEYSILGIDVYHLALYRPVDQLNKENPEIQLLEFKFATDIDKKYLNKGWDRGIDKNITLFNKRSIDELPNQMSWLYKNTPHVKEGDVFQIFVQENEVHFYYQNNLIAQTTDSTLKDMVFLPWIGEFPVDMSLKRNLLNQRK